MRETLAYTYVMNPKTRDSVVGILLVVLIVAGVALLAPGTSDNAKHQDTTTRKEGSPPPMTENMKRVLSKSVGFQHLVSLTDNGFEPANLSIRKGESVRFMNNSNTKDMWISSYAGEGNLYPGVNADCGQSPFDTCVPLPKYEFWEFTFDTAGTWSYRNAADTASIGVISVEE